MVSMHKVGVITVRALLICAVIAAIGVAIFYDPDSTEYDSVTGFLSYSWQRFFGEPECSYADRGACRGNLKCMWVFEGDDQEGGVCTVRKLGDPIDCTTLTGGVECNRRNDRCITTVDGRCATRPSSEAPSPTPGPSPGPDPGPAPHPEPVHCYDITTSGTCREDPSCAWKFKGEDPTAGACVPRKLGSTVECDKLPRGNECNRNNDYCISSKEGCVFRPNPPPWHEGAWPPAKGPTEPTPSNCAVHSERGPCRYDPMCRWDYQGEDHEKGVCNVRDVLTPAVDCTKITNGHPCNRTNNWCLSSKQGCAFRPNPPPGYEGSWPPQLTPGPGEPPSPGACGVHKERGPCRYDPLCKWEYEGEDQAKGVCNARVGGTPVDCTKIDKGHPCNKTNNWCISSREGCLFRPNPPPGYEGPWPPTQGPAPTEPEPTPDPTPEPTPEPTPDPGPTPTPVPDTDANVVCAYRGCVPRRLLYAVPLELDNGTTDRLVLKLKAQGKSGVDKVHGGLVNYNGSGALSSSQGNALIDIVHLATKIPKNEIIISNIRGYYGMNVQVMRKTKHDSSNEVVKNTHMVAAPAYPKFTETQITTIARDSLTCMSCA